MFYMYQSNIQINFLFVDRTVTVQWINTSGAMGRECKIKYNSCKGIPDAWLQNSNSIRI